MSWIACVGLCRGRTALRGPRAAHGVRWMRTWLSMRWSRALSSWPAALTGEGLQHAPTCLPDPARPSLPACLPDPACPCLPACPPTCLIGVWLLPVFELCLRCATLLGGWLIVGWVAHCWAGWLQTGSRPGWLAPGWLIAGWLAVRDVAIMCSVPLAPPCTHTPTHACMHACTHTRMHAPHAGPTSSAPPFSSVPGVVSERPPSSHARLSSTCYCGHS